MRSYNDRKASQGSKKARWDDDLSFIEINARGREIRPISFIQEVVRYWIPFDGAEWAETIRKAKKKARREGREYKPPRRPVGFPVMCPRFDPITERFVDYRDPVTGIGYPARETVTVKDLTRQGIALPEELRRAQKRMRSKNASTSAKRAAKDLLTDARFAKSSLELGRAVELTRISDPLSEDFNWRADRRTLFYGIDREKQRKKGRITDECVGIVNKGGVPYSAWTALDRIGDAIQADPFDAVDGVDVRITKDTNQPAAQMWSVVNIRPAKLTTKERAVVFGKYKLSDGKTVGFDTVIHLRAEARKVGSDGKGTQEARKAKKLLKGMKVLKPAAVAPLDQMILDDMIDGEEIRSILVERGYYDKNGNPLPELIEEDKRKKSYGKDDDDDEDDDDDLLDDEEEDEDDYDDDDEDEEEEPRRRKKKSPSSSSKKKRRRRRDDDDEDDDEPRRRKKKSSSGSSKKGKSSSKSKKDRDSKSSRSKKSGDKKKRRRRSTLD